MVAGVFKAKIDPRVEFESQDQLFIFATTAGGGHREEIPLVRGRTPNGRPWIPQDGFSLHAKGLGQLPTPLVYTECAGSASNISSGICAEVTVVCTDTNATQISGSLGAKNTCFLSRFYTQTINLPRQARDKHQER